MPEYDVAVVGAGIGGYTAAIRASQLGLRAAIIEKDAIGGLCLNWGCIPSKALLHAADVVQTLRESEALGIYHSNLRLDLGVAVDRSREVVQKLVGGVETLLKQNKVTVIRGTGRLTADSKVRIEETGDIVDAVNVIVATGASTRGLPAVPIDGERVITSREALALSRVPSSIAIIGGGAVGVEFAYLYRAYGAEVTILELLPRLLPNEDADIGRQLERSFRGQGIAVRTGVSVSGVQVDGDAAMVTFSGDKGEEALPVERVLVGVGFGPGPDTLGLAEAGIELERGWVKVDAYCRTNVPGIWAIGDLTGALLLAHVAAAQGLCAVETIAGRDPVPMSYETMPRAVYCRPEVGAMGLTEAQARERGIDVVTGRFPLGANGKAVAVGETEGFVKVVVDKGSGAIVGVHAIGGRATELMGEASLARLLESTLLEIGQTVHPHPTFSEALKEAALAAGGEAIHFFSARHS